MSTQVLPRLSWAVLGASLALSGCSSSPDDTEREGSLVGGTGPLPGAIQGVHYQAGDRAGYTDASGSFRYRSGESIRFSVGALEFQSVKGATRVSPFQLANGAGCAVGDPLTRVLQALQSLDMDANPDNGVSVPELPAEGAAVAVSDLGEAELAAAIQTASPGASLVAAGVALERFIRQIDDEAWEKEPGTTFPFPDSAYHGQGVASDGKDWIFSSANHLLRSSATFEELAVNAQPIPLEIFKQGGKHIGDIDVHEGLLYAPIEDGDFLHPYVVTYDAKTLEPTGNNRLLPVELQPDGVPWLAVDGPRQRIYTAEWDPTDHLNVYDLANDLAPLKSIPLSPAIGRIQGAKVFGGQLYASSDNENKSIYKIDLDTGTVLELFALGTPKSEAEGLALTRDADGPRLHVLNVVVPSVDFVEFLRTRDPLRDSICP